MLVKPEENRVELFRALQIEEVVERSQHATAEWCCSVDYSYSYEKVD